MSSHGWLPLTMLVVTLGAVQACTSATSSVVSPTAAKCQGPVAASGTPTSFGYAGGTGRVTVEAARDCTWTAATEVSWITIEGPTQGQGEATVSYRVMANATPLARRGGLTLSGTRVDVAQEGAPCRYALSHTTVSVPSSGGTATVRVVAMKGCPWIASSPEGWVEISRGQSGDGDGDLVLLVHGNSGAARSAQVGVADQVLTVVQANAASPVPSPPGPTPTPPPPSPPPPLPPPPGPPPAPGPFPLGRASVDGAIQDLGGTCPAVRFQLRDLSVYAHADTRFRRGSCGALRNGERVEVQGRHMSDGTVRADEIERRRGGGDDDDAD